MLFKSSLYDFFSACDFHFKSGPKDGEKTHLGPTFTPKKSFAFSLESEMASFS